MLLAPLFRRGSHIATARALPTRALPTNSWSSWSNFHLVDQVDQQFTSFLASRPKLEKGQPLYSERRWDGEKTLVATRQISRGERVYTVSRAAQFLLAQPDMHSVQLTRDEHLDFANALPAASLTHHECDPNGDLHITGGGVTFRARREIAEGEILSFDYNTTEWLLESPFLCRCGNESCVGHVGGFSLLPPDQQAELLPRTSPWIRSLVIDQWRSVMATQKQ